MGTEVPSAPLLFLRSIFFFSFTKQSLRVVQHVVQVLTTE